VNIIYAFTALAYDAQKHHYIMLHKRLCLSAVLYVYDQSPLTQKGPKN